MKKHLRVLFTLALAVCLAATGCSLVSVDEEKDKAQIVAKVGDLQITKGEYVEYFEQVYNMYLQYGYDPAGTDEELSTFQQNVLDDLIYDKMYIYQAKLQGYTELTEEDKATLEESYKNADDIIYGEALAQAEAEFAEDPDIDVDARAAELFPEVCEYYVGERMTREEFKPWWEEQSKDGLLTDRMVQDFNDTITVTPEEVRAEYEEQLASVKTTMAETPGTYKTEQESYEKYDGMPSLYTPEGYRRVKHILITAEEELDAAYSDFEIDMQELQMELGQLTLAGEEENAARIAEIKTEYADLTQKSAAMLEAWLAPMRAKAEEAYAKLQGGASFEDVMAQYTSDEEFINYDVFKQNGKLMSSYESTPDWSEAVKTATMALTQPGSYTALVQDDDGFHILQYVSNETPGDRAYEEVQDMIEADTLSAKQSEEWNALMEAWVADTTLVERFVSLIADVGK